MKILTPQKMFDDFVVHMIKQGGRSIQINGHCVYRGPNGRRCGIGKFILNHQYTKKMDNDAMSFHTIDGNYNLPQFRDLPEEFGTDLQVLHDTAFTPETSIKCTMNELRTFANEYNLDTTILSNVKWPTSWKDD